MERYALVILYAFPVLLAVVLFEKWYGHKKGLNASPLADVITSLSAAGIFFVTNLFNLTISFLTYPFFLANLSFFKVQDERLIYFIAFVAIDFSNYWIHRWRHEFNALWNAHLIHHSSEEFNIGVGIRQGIVRFFNPYAFLLIPAAVFGVPAKVIFPVAMVHAALQVWYHTRHIGKLGWLEKIIVTPSHHRVHHGINKEYLGKNYSAFFIVWDKMFGTFQEELDDVPVVYGSVRPAETWNPVKINFQHLWLMLSDMLRAGSLKDKVILWFKPNGYRPADVSLNHPVKEVHDIKTFKKFEMLGDSHLIKWCVFQMSCVFFFVMWMMFNISEVKAMGMGYAYAYAVFIFSAVYALSEYMDGNPHAFVFEILKNMYGVVLLFLQKNWDWFGLASYSRLLVYLVLFYFIASIIWGAQLSSKKNLTTS